MPLVLLPCAAGVIEEGRRLSAVALPQIAERHNTVGRNLFVPEKRSKE